MGILMEQDVEDTETTSHQYLIHKCQYCELRFIRNSHLLRHLNEQHSYLLKEARYHCNDCSKIFDKKDKLDDHYHRKHTNQCRTKCSQCRKIFKSKYCLGKHVTLIHSFAHRCNECDKVLPSFDGLHKHVQSKHYMKNLCYKCDNCWSIFKKEDSLINHVKRMHSKVIT